MTGSALRAVTDETNTSLRRVPVPDTEPPFDSEPSFDDETVATPTTSAAGVQGTLALAFALPNGLPALPAVPDPEQADPRRRLRLVPTTDPGKTGRSTGRRRGSRDPNDFGPQPTPRAQLPEPRPWAGRLVQAIVEVTSGARPVGQLIRWTTTDVYDTIQRRIARAGLLGETGKRVGAIVRSVRVDEPVDGVAEVCAVIQHGARCRAIALRLEGVDGRWQCTALQVG
jgi:hypothetical protein